VGAWPLVEEGEGDPPGPSAGWVDEDLILTQNPQVLAWGRVDGIAWQIDAWSTAPGPGAQWWEHGPVGPEMAFSLGEGARFGGGGSETRLNDGTDLAASIHFFGSSPSIVSWIGVVSDRVAHIEVRIDDGETRTVDIRHGPPLLPRLFSFFPPRGATGTVVAIGVGGEELQTETLLDTDVPPNANAGTSVNGLGYAADRPPPGWPDDPTQYEPGEGPRHAENFHLHEATFPLYVVHPEKWKGYVQTSGSSASGSRVDDVSFGYFEKPGGGGRGFEVTSERPDVDRRFERPIREEDVGIWWSDSFATLAPINFAPRFISHELTQGLRDERGFPNLGPTRIAAIVEIEVAGLRVRCIRTEYRLLPPLRSIRFELPDVRVALHGWALTVDELEGFARTLERLELGTPLLRAMQAAEARSDARFQELHGRHHAHPDEP
jgi:hypothetical protein